jgi:hypothetical protein
MPRRGIRILGVVPKTGLQGAWPVVINGADHWGIDEVRPDFSPAAPITIDLSSGKKLQVTAVVVNPTGENYQVMVMVGRIVDVPAGVSLPDPNVRKLFLPRQSYISENNYAWAGKTTSVTTTVSPPAILTASETYDLAVIVFQLIPGMGGGPYGYKVGLSVAVPRVLTVTKQQPLPTPGILKIDGVSYSTTTPGPCQQITAWVTIRNTGGTDLSGRLYGTLYLAGTSNYAGCFYPTANANLDNPPRTPLIISVPANSTKTFMMYSGAIGEYRTMDVAWQTEDLSGNFYNRFVDSGRIKPTFSSWQQHCPPFF